MLVPVKDVVIVPNKKPWIAQDIATLLIQGKQAFRERNTDEMKNLQKKARGQITKITFRKKVETSYKTNNSRQL